MASTKKRKCKECRTEVHGRRDKVFCSDDCRVTFNNKLNRDSTTLMRNVNNTLRKNRRILKQHNPKGKCKVERMQLQESGFNFNYFTNIYKTKAGKVYYFCYEQGYLEIDENKLALVTRQDYVK